MVQVQVRVQHPANLETGILYIYGEGIALPLVARARVYEYGIPRIVAQHVGIHTKGIENKLFDLHAENVEKRGNYNGKMGKKGGMAGVTALSKKK
jgi:hypothetical protein